MVGRKRGKPEREHGEDTVEASTTAVEPNPTGTVIPAIRVFDPSEPSPSPDTGTPLPDDPSILKENVKGLKSQLRKQKRQACISASSSTAHEAYAAIAGTGVIFYQEEVLIPIRNHQLRPICCCHTT